MKIVLFAPSMATFVRNDMEILGEIATVNTVMLSSTKGFGLLISLIKQFWKLIKHGASADVFYIWFADYHSLLPVLIGRILGKRTYIVLGGTDVNCLPELNYGFCTNPLRRFCTWFSILYCSCLLPVDESLELKLLSRYRTISGKISTVYTGFDPVKWYNDNIKKNQILTVGIFAGIQRIKIKGLDFFCEVAKLLPEYQFIVVGAVSPAEKLLDQSDNLQVYNQRLDHEELRKLFSESRIYAQFSLTEGLPSTVCEAMLCECIPVGMDVGGMRNVIGDTGLIFENRDPLMVSKKIRDLMKDSTKGENCRRRIMQRFNFETRKKRIHEMLLSIS